MYSILLLLATPVLTPLASVFSPTAITTVMSFPTMPWQSRRLISSSSFWIPAEALHGYMLHALPDVLDHHQATWHPGHYQTIRMGKGKKREVHLKHSCEIVLLFYMCYGTCSLVEQPNNTNPLGYKCLLDFHLLKLCACLLAKTVAFAMHPNQPRLIYLVSP